MSTRITTLTLSTSGEVTVNEVDQDKLLAHLQRSVGGYVQIVNIADVTIWLNDEGLLQELPFNPIATAFARALTRLQYTFVGDVVFTGGADENGDALGLLPNEVATLREAIEQLRVFVI